MSIALGYKRPLVKLSGEALMGGQPYGIDPATLAHIAADIAALPTGPALPIVVGGGNIYRGVTAAAAGMDRVKADFLGMLATVMNAFALEQALEDAGIKAKVYSGLPMPSVCDVYTRDRAAADIHAGLAVILGGGTGNPFFTTDTTAALRAAELGCDAILKATQVDGVYSADPRTDINANRYDRVSFSEVLSRDLKVMDAAAIALARENRIPIVVFRLAGDGSIGNTLRGIGSCTIVDG